MNNKTKKLLQATCKSRGLGQETEASILLLIATKKWLTREVNSIGEANSLLDKSLKYF